MVSFHQQSRNLRHTPYLADSYLVEQAIVVEARAADEDLHSHSLQHPKPEHGLGSFAREFHPFGIEADGMRFDLLPFQGVDETIEHVQAKLPVCLADAAQPFLPYQYDNLIHGHTPENQSGTRWNREILPQIFLETTKYTKHTKSISRGISGSNLRLFVYFVYFVVLIFALPAFRGDVVVW